MWFDLIRTQQTQDIIFIVVGIVIIIKYLLSRNIGKKTGVPAVVQKERWNYLVLILKGRGGLPCWRSG